ncbi:hypothetical protein [Paraburkholderia rhynchosiae]|uniref:Uncharacterized protein n=1 Tax=Paraburkholderia rhynchosiae TaxID=487049 RepID=A0A6J5CTY5_9BURK|nr:hypothetical protein [Paraburkholderia rhynchosiae]CAB3743598.1 hypothetical protein LMG27174_07016 [Paraburkholderia rhynchosiae]
MRSYAGEIYIGLPFDEIDARYHKLQAFLDYPDGTARFDDVRLFIVTLQLALDNAHHDETGFWDRWADNYNRQIPFSETTATHARGLFEAEHIGDLTDDELRNNQPPILLGRRRLPQVQWPGRR